MIRRHERFSRSSIRRAVGSPVVDRFLARAIGTHNLPPERRQYSHRWIQPLAMLRQDRLRHVEQLGTCKQIEKATPSTRCASRIICRLFRSEQNSALGSATVGIGVGYVEV